jgi:hypothetical protein
MKKIQMAFTFAILFLAFGNGFSQQLSWHLLPLPAGYVYFDLGKDASADSAGNYSKPDFFTNGRANFNFQFITLDYLWGERDNGIQAGFFGSVGLSTNNRGTTEDPAYLIGNFGGVISFAKLFKLEAGICAGVSANESYTNPFDASIFVGISLPTKLSDKLTDAVGNAVQSIF